MGCDAPIPERVSQRTRRSSRGSVPRSAWNSGDRVPGTSYLLRSPWPRRASRHASPQRGIKWPPDHTSLFCAIAIRNSRGFANRQNRCNRDIPRRCPCRASEQRIRSGHGPASGTGLDIDGDGPRHQPWWLCRATVSGFGRDGPTCNRGHAILPSQPGGGPVRPPLGRSLKHLIELMAELEAERIGFQSVTESIDTTTTGGKLVFHIFGALAEIEHNLIRERTYAVLAAARAAAGKAAGEKSSVKSSVPWPSTCTAKRSTQLRRFAKRSAYRGRRFTSMSRRRATDDDRPKGCGAGVLRGRLKAPAESRDASHSLRISPAVQPILSLHSDVDQCDFD